MKESSKLLTKLEKGERLTLDESRLFIREIHKAVTDGRILSDDRPLRLYRVIKEINDETRRNEGIWKGVETRRTNRGVQNA